MSIVRWEPFREIARVREEMDRFFDGGHHTHLLWRLWPEPYGVPVDIYETPETVVVKASLPGVKPEEVEITVTDETLSIKGVSKSEEEIKEEDYYHQERRYGSFSRSIGLPSGLKTDKAEAVFENGVLTLTIPKAEEVKPKSIKVQAKAVLEGKKS